MLLELLKTVLLGLVEGVTEWLPISSTGHMILLNEALRLNVGDEFWKLFEVVIQLGAILAVIVLYFRRLNPFAPSKTPEQRLDTWTLWLKVIVAVLPSGLIGVALDDWFDAHLYNYVTVAIALILYGVVFLGLDRLELGRHARRIGDVGQISYRTAFLIGCFQVLALIPGTSRSGSTIIGALLLGLTRPAAAEFSFFMAIPTMLGASLVKAAKYLLSGASMSGSEAVILITGCAVAFAVSLAAIRGLVRYVRTHSFRVFGVYRILLGAVVLLWFALR